MDELDALLALSFTSGLGPVRIRALLDRFGSATAALEAPAAESREVARTQVSPTSVALERARACRASCKRYDITMIGFTDGRYPQALRSLHDPPPLLFVRGTLPAGVSGPSDWLRSVAVVGTRDPTARARGFAVALGREIAAAGIVVVSGLALGIDGAAHEGVLEAAAAPAVAVLAGGVEVIRPAVHSRLAGRILASGGAVLSEDPPGLRPEPHRFVARNRIVSGLARGVVVVEAGARSGALHTAEFALDQGRDVLAVPDHPSTPRAQGSLRLLADGATMILRPSDVMEHFGFPFRPEAPAAPEAGSALLQELAELGPCTIDRLTGEPVEKLILLAELEIGGFVSRDGSGRYRLSHQGIAVLEGAARKDRDASEPSRQHEIRRVD